MDIVSRESAIHLLKEIILENGWLKDVPIIHLSKNPETMSWELHIKTDRADGQILKQIEKIAGKYNIQILKDPKEGYLVFRERSE